nr:MAG TPA: hypothetical protein [Caudoviricetes sp.]
MISTLPLWWGIYSQEMVYFFELFTVYIYGEYLSIDIY